MHTCRPEREGTIWVTCIPSGLTAKAQFEEISKIKQQLGNSMVVAARVLSERNIYDSIISLTVVRSIWWDHSSRASTKQNSKDHVRYSSGLAGGSWVSSLRQVLFDSLADIGNLTRMGLDCTLAASTQEQDLLANRIANLAVHSPSEKK